MLVEDQMIQISWNNNNKDWYISKGYEFTKIRQPLIVNAKDLTLKSNKKVDIICDYCGDLTSRTFSDYNNSLKESVIKKDCCMKCKPIKNKEAYMALYGVEHQSQVKEIRDKIAESQRLDYSYVKSEFEKCAYELLSTEYINAKIPLEYTCQKHIDQGIQKIQYSNFQQGKRCKYCNIDMNREKLHLKYKAIVEERDFTFIRLVFSGYTKKQKFKMEIICNKHCDKGEQLVSYSNFCKQSGCKYCGREKQGIKKRVNITDVKKVFNTRDYTVLNVDEYKNNKTKLRYICNKHPELSYQFTDYANISRANTCRSCIYEAISGENHYLWKGGISPLHTYLRYKINDWKRESLKKYDYKCALSNSKDNLIVHHLIGFSTILDECMSKLGFPILPTVNSYSDEELLSIEKLIVQKHWDYGLGIPLTSELHSLFHKLYGTGGNTPDQFEDFKNRYNNNEFREVS